MISTPIAEGGLCILFLMTGIKYCRISLMALKLTFMNLKIKIELKLKDIYILCFMFLIHLII